MEELAGNDTVRAHYCEGVSLFRSHIKAIFHADDVFTSLIPRVKKIAHLVIALRS